MIKRGIDFQYDSVYYDEYEKNSIWLIERATNNLCQIDFDKNTYIFHCILPGKEYRWNPRCIRYNDYIVCLPDRGDSFVLYNIENKTISKKLIENNKKVRLSIYNYWIRNNRVWCMSKGLKCIIEFNLDRMEIEGYYPVYTDQDELFAFDADMNSNTIISVSVNSNRIYCFDTETRKVSHYTIPFHEKGYNTISWCDGKVLLSGYSEEITVFDTNSNSVRMIDIGGFLHVFDNKGKELHGNLDEALFKKSIIVDDSVVFVPRYSENVLADSFIIFNMDSGKIKSVCIEKELFNSDNIDGKRVFDLFRLPEKGLFEVYLDGFEPILYDLGHEKIVHKKEDIKNCKYEKSFFVGSVSFEKRQTD